jgi:hypothetical protein
MNRYVKIMTFFLGFLPVFTASAQKPDKVQQAVDAIKAANYCEDDDYHTDGQRVVWVKSYKKWTPDDLILMQKEDPAILKFLGQAIQHKRYDVLEQLLPNYYRAQGGAKAFAADIIQASQATGSAGK